MTSIEWARNADGTQGKTWNPSVGCNRVSPGCDNCYAMHFEHRFSGEGQRSHGLTMYREGDGPHGGADWTGRVNFYPERLLLPLRRKVPTTYFVNSVSDLFHKNLALDQIAAVYGVMAAARWHRFIVLTKRVREAREFYDWLAARAARDRVTPAFLCGTEAARRIDAPSDVNLLRLPNVWPLPNVVIGVSAEDQERWNARMRFVHEVPAAMRVASLEPLLGPINLRGTGRLHLNGVFVGGESGTGARACNVEWVRSIVAQCRESDIACFVKQFGACFVDEENGLGGAQARPDPQLVPRIRRLTSRKGSDMSEWPEDLRVRELPWQSTI